MDSGKKIFKLNSSLSLSEDVEDQPSGNVSAKSSNKPLSKTNIYSNNNKSAMVKPTTTSKGPPQGCITEDLRRLTSLEAQEEQRLPLKFLIMVGLFVIVLLVGLIVVVAVFLTGGSDDSSSPAQVPIANTRAPSTLAPTPAPTPLVSLAPQVVLPTPEPATTLGRVAQRGVLRCGIPENAGFAEINFETGLYEGFDVDMCRAVAAAIFGEDNKVEYVVLNAFWRFQALADDEVDMFARVTTHTMERQVFEATTGQGFSFTVPYLYNGLQFGGDPFYVRCADDFNSTGACAETRICALDGTTHQTDITSLAPDISVVSTVDSATFYRSFINGFCNVIGGEQFDIAESVVRGRGYLGDYALGMKVHSKEPLAMVTRDDDPEWSDFVNWVLQGLLAADEAGITSVAANVMGSTDAFGEQFSGMFMNAVRIVGNYGEIYSRHLEPILPRPLPDYINNGTTGLIYSLPYGSLEPIGEGPTLGGTLETIRDRGFLRCGISSRAIFAQFDTATQTWSGFDVDFCRAIAAAIFDGDGTKVNFTDLPTSERFHSLHNGEIDLLARLVTVTLSRDVLEPSTQVGFSFTQPTFFDGLSFGGIPPYAQCANSLDVTSSSCKDLLICVNEGTTFESRVASLFPARFIVPRQSGESAVEGLTTGDCNALAGGVVDVSLTSVRNAGFLGEYQVGSGRYSNDPLALVTRQDDEQWSKFVFWVVTTIFGAEEKGISQATADQLPTVRLFGPLFFNAFQNAIGAVGNYAEIYERSAEAYVPRGGLNTVNVLLSGPQHYPLPGIF